MEVSTLRELEKVKRPWWKTMVDELDKMREAGMANLFKALEAASWKLTFQGMRESGIPEQKI